ncbi:MAG: hypothetical protein KAS29_00825 [Bacteroidales bacterium]|nr:hypothetical protein [Bacteroidales bacterium]
MIEKDSGTASETKTRSLKSLINTPFKRAMFVIQLISYVLIVGSPLIGGAIGGLIGLKATKIGGLILGVFITGEVLFYGSLAFLGKEVVLLIRDKLKVWFKRKNRKSV